MQNLFRRAKNHLNNASWLMFEQFVRMFTGLYVGGLVAKKIGPDIFGEINYAITIITITIPLCKFGLDGLFAKYIIKNPRRSNYYLFAAIVFRLFISISTCLLVICIYFLFSEKSSILFYVLVPILIFQSFDTIEMYYTALSKIKLLVTIKIFQSIFSAAIKLCLIFFDSNVLYFAAAVVFDNFLLAAIYCFFAKKEILFFRLSRISFIFAKKVFFDGWPLVISGFVAAVYVKLDQLIVASMLGKKDFGIYSASAKLLDVLYVFPVIFSSIVYPVLLRAKNKNKNAFLEKVRLCFLFAVLISFIIVFFVWMAAPFVVNGLYGDGYSGAINILRVQIFSLPFVSMGVVVGKVYLIDGLQRLTLVRTIVALLINIPIAMVLISNIGLKGACFSLILSQVISVFFMNMAFKDTRWIFYEQLKIFSLGNFVKKDLCN